MQHQRLYRFYIVDANHIFSKSETRRWELQNQSIPSKILRSFFLKKIFQQNPRKKHAIRPTYPSQIHKGKRKRKRPANFSVIMAVGIWFMIAWHIYGLFLAHIHLLDTTGCFLVYLGTARSNRPFYSSFLLSTSK